MVANFIPDEGQSWITYPWIQVHVHIKAKHSIIVASSSTFEKQILILLKCQFGLQSPK